MLDTLGLHGSFCQDFLLYKFSTLSHLIHLEGGLCHNCLNQSKFDCKDKRPILTYLCWGRGGGYWMDTGKVQLDFLESCSYSLLISVSLSPSLSLSEARWLPVLVAHEGWPTTPCATTKWDGPGRGCKSLSIY